MDHILNLPPFYNVLEKQTYAHIYAVIGTLLLIMNKGALAYTTFNMIVAKDLTSLTENSIRLLILAQLANFFVTKNYTYYNLQKYENTGLPELMVLLAFVALILTVYISFLKKNPLYNCKKGCNGEICKNDHCR